MMKKACILFLLAASIALPVAHAASPLGPDEFTSVDELALAVAAYFPKVRGEVTAVQGGQLTINIGRKDGIVPNMVLSLWRDGKELLHPVTKAVIGRAENEVGAVEITASGEASSTAVMKRTVLAPQTGDRARITPRKISIAIVPLRSDKPEIVEGLVERMGELGRFTVLEPQKVHAFLAERKQRDATLVREMGAAFALDAVVAVAVLPSDGKSLITSRIFYADETQPLDTIVATLNLTSRREALGDVRPFFAPVKEVKMEGVRTPHLPGEARYFAVADVDGDGKQEFVFSDGGMISVLRLDAGAWQTVWTETLARAERSGRQIALDAADINGNKRAEIFVTRMLEGTVASYVLEFQEGSFKRIAELPGFLRVISAPGKGAVLLGQAYDPENLFTGKPRQLVWSGAGYTTDAVLSVPKGVNLYGFALANLGEVQPLIVALDKDDRLTVYTGETSIWKSEEEYHPVATTVIKPLTGLDAAVGRTPSELDRTMNTASALDEKGRQARVPGRVLAADMAGKGVEDIIVAKNTSKTFVGSYEGGQMHGLTWTGARLNPRWVIQDLPGPVLDVQVVRESDRTAAYALIKEQGGLFKKDVFWLERYDGK